MDSRYREAITVFYAEGRPHMTVNEMTTAWNSYSRKVISQLKGAAATDKTRVAPYLTIVGEKTLKIRSGEIIAKQLKVPYIKGGTAIGMEVQMPEKDRVYHIAGCTLREGTPFSERGFVEFLNTWQSWQHAESYWHQSLSAEQKSMAYTKRGEWLGKIIVRKPDALADFQKAVNLDPNNWEARTQLESLMKE